MTDVRLTATNPVDSSVVPVACNTKGELLVEQEPGGVYVKLDDEGTKQVIKSDGLGISDGTTENITLNADGSASFNPSSDGVNIDSSSRLVVGTSSAFAIDSNKYPAFQINRPGSNGLNASILVREHELSTSWPRLIISKNRDNNNMQTANKLGSVDFYGDSGASDHRGASVTATAESVWSSTSAPTRLEFSTTESNASSPTERMVVTSQGNVRIGGTLPSAPNISMNASGDASFAGDVVIGSRGQQWMIVESGGIAHLVAQTFSEKETSYPELRNIPQELTMVEQQLQQVMERLRMVPEAGWEVWDGDNS